MSKLTGSTPFINVLVKVRPGSEPGTYKVETAPATPWVTQPDTVINYQLYDCGGTDIVFTGMTVSPNDQLSPASLSVSGKQLTFSDANTSVMSISFTLNFKDQDGVQFMHDPEVRNEPER